MILWGESALYASIITSFVSVSLGFWGLQLSFFKNVLGRLVRAATSFTTGFVLLALLSLIDAFLRDNFSLVMVVENSHTLTPWFYKLVALWSNHEGSMVLWLATLSCVTWIYSRIAKEQTLSIQVYTLSIQNLIFLIFLLYTLIFANPFEKTVFQYEEGLDLNPLLQDPSMIFHPPGLYFGFVGSSLLFSFTLGGILSGQVDTTWIHHNRHYALWVWILMVLGLVSGSWWAYYELGWGGWWFWDPVENIALMPFLMVTALIHLLMIYSKSGRFQHLTLLLSWGTFVFVLVGTFFVKSGLLVSVHSFAEEPSRRIALLSCCLVLIGLGTFVHSFRTIPAYEGPLKLPPRLPLISRGSFLLMFVVSILFSVGVIVVGTYYPYFVQVFLNQHLVVGAPYFEQLLLPVGLIVLLLGAPSFLIKWPKMQGAVVLKWMQFPIMIALLAILLLGYAQSSVPFMGGAILVASLFFIAATGVAYNHKRSEIWGATHKKDMTYWRTLIARHGKYLAHLGFGISLLGMSADALWKKEALFALKEGQSATVLEYTFQLDQIITLESERVQDLQAVVLMKKPEKKDIIATFKPSRTYFKPRETVTIETALYHKGLSDYHISLGDMFSDKRHVLKLQYHPYISLIWIGALIMILGGAIIGLKPRKS